MRDEGAHLPALRMIREPAASIRRERRSLAARLRDAGKSVTGESVIGGGSTPEQSLPTYLLALPDAARGGSTELRAGRPPVIGRMEKGRLLLDLRTVFREQEPVVAGCAAGASSN